MEELRTGTGKPMTPFESTRLFRANVMNLWRRAPWFPLATIWFPRNLETDFTEHCRRAGLVPDQTAPVVLNTLRWCWRRSVLNYNDDPGWQRALAAARKRMAKIGPPPEGYSYTPPADTPPTDPRINTVTQRMDPYQAAQAGTPVDRTTKAKARKAHGHRFRAPASFDWSAFLSEHWSETFGPLFRSHRLDPDEADGELGRRLAVAWRAVLDERERLDGAVGAANRNWHALLREIKQDREQGTGHYLRRP
jgi:hypothetical protein